jgi:DNA-binding transcriptional LysR family regulator
MTQSAITKRVRELEESTGLPLFDRTHRTARLTEKGEHVLALAQDMLELQHQVMQVQHGTEPPARRLRLGVTELTALTWLPRLVAALHKRHPGILIETEVRLSRDLFEWLQDDRLDVIIVPTGFSDENVTAVPLAEDHNVWMGSPALVRTRRRLPIAELAAYPILVQSNRSGSGLWVSRWLKAESVSAPNLIACDSLIALLGLAVAGLGVTYLPAQCFAPLVAQGKLRVIPTNPELPDIPYVALYRHDRPSSFSDTVAQLAKDTCDFSRQFQS